MIGRWDEERVRRLEAENRELRDRVAKSEGALEAMERSLDRVVSSLDVLRERGSAAYSSMDAARAAFEAEQPDAENNQVVDSFWKRMDEVHGVGLSVEEMLSRGAFRSGRETDPEAEAERE